MNSKPIISWQKKQSISLLDCLMSVWVKLRVGTVIGVLLKERRVRFLKVSVLKQNMHSVLSIIIFYWLHNPDINYSLHSKLYNRVETQTTSLSRRIWSPLEMSPRTTYFEMYSPPDHNLRNILSEGTLRFEIYGPPLKAFLPQDCIFRIRFWNMQPPPPRP